MLKSLTLLQYIVRRCLYSLCYCHYFILMNKGEHLTVCYVGCRTTHPKINSPKNQLTQVVNNSPKLFGQLVQIFGQLTQVFGQHTQVLKYMKWLFMLRNAFGFIKITFQVFARQFWIYNILRPLKYFLIFLFKIKATITDWWN